MPSTLEEDDQNALDLIRKLIEDDKTEEEALTIWEKEQGICDFCGADKLAYLETMGEPCEKGHGERR